MNFFKTIFLLLSFCLIAPCAFAQNISGRVYNTDNEPIPFVNIFVNQLQTGTSADENGMYFLNVDVGEYDFVFSALGYETQKIRVTIIDGNNRNDIFLKDSNVELEEVLVKASKKNPGYEIIRKVIDRRKQFLKQVDSYRSEVYIKAVEKIDEKESPRSAKKKAKELAAKEKKAEEKKEEEKKKRKKSSIDVGDVSDTKVDPFAEAKDKEAKAIAKVNLVEMQLTLNYQYPGKYKEERTAYKVSGKKDGLFVPRFDEADFNFYKNLVDFTGITELPIVSPISRTAILSYKYKLLESKKENGRIVHKIKVTPRKKGNATCSGYIYINDEIWNINRLDFNFYKGGLKFYDRFRIRQNYENVSDSIWLPTRQEFNYETKSGKYKNYEGETLIKISDFDKTYIFPEKFFNNEIAVTTKEAMDRDSTYWTTIRPEPLPIDQAKVIRYRDSVYAVHNSIEYKDSLDRDFNRIDFMDVVWDGVGIRNHKKKQQIFLAPLAASIDFEVVGGFRVGTFLGYFRRFENGQRLSAFTAANVGLINKDFQMFIDQSFLYNPHKLAEIDFGIGRQFQNINTYDSFINQLNSGNYFLHDYLNLSHRFEILNGLYLTTAASMNNRQSIEGFKRYSFLTEWIAEEELTPFQTYQALFTDLMVSYTPRQKYMTEPTRKVVLGSKWPTFSMLHRKGWNGLFGSDINFDYLRFQIQQEVVVGTLGNSNYTVKMGGFVNTKDLRFIDFKRFRESDPYFFSNPLHSFQLLDTQLIANKFFFEVHHIHHFNGALVNNIPLIKFLKIRLVAGGGFLWVQESKFRYMEAFAGIERIFKLGPRRRLRLGGYGVIGNSTLQSSLPGIKFSIDIIDTWKRDWEY